MKKNKILEALSQSTSFIYIIIVLICAGMTFKESYAAAVVLFASSSIMFIHLFTQRRLRMNKMKNYFDRMEGITLEQNNKLMFKIPDPIAGIRVDGTLAWYNIPFRKSFLQNNFNVRICEIFPEVVVKDIIADRGVHSIQVKYNSHEYRILPTIVNNSDPEKAAIILYFENITDINRLKSIADDLKPVVVSIKIDNYDETIADAQENEQLELTASIDRNIINWVSSMNGLTRKLEKDRFIAIFSQGSYKKICEARFDILNEIRSIKVLSAPAPTLSIGVGMGGDNLSECDSFARAALDMALGRGGDQAAVCDGGKFSYFGGSAKEVEKRTKVKARVMARSLKERIASAENVVIMGHKSADIDAIGAAIGIASAVSYFGKEAKILLNSEDSAVNSIVDIITKNHYHDDMFVSRSQVWSYINPDETLLIVCDTHRPELTEMPELLEAVKHRILLDHHRRSESFIEGCEVVYHEPGASSTCEMVTEILMYIDSGLRLSTIDATALYSGIILDTKNFVFKTGSRTFEAAAYLRNAGVDTIKVKQFFRESAQNHNIINSIVSEAQIDEIGMALALVNDEVPTAIAAQAADEILNIDKVTASFVITKEQNGAKISARSLGEVNVQLIMEALGGGGHAMAAAVQLSKTTVDEAAMQLKEIIENSEKNI